MATALVIATILLSPVLLSLALGMLFLGNRLQLFPHGIPAAINFGLSSCLILGLLSLCNTIDALIVTPASFQEEYLGARYASPAQLQRAEIVPAMMDWSTYTYLLSAREAATLRRRCRSTYYLGAEHGCILFSDTDESWFAEVRLSDGDELQIRDGLH
jgi:hypothetical protein